MSWFSSTKAVYKREMRSLVVSPSVWILVGMAQVIFGLSIFSLLLWQYMEKLDDLRLLQSSFGITSIVVVPFLRSSVLFLSIITPLLSMRMLADERRNNSYLLLVLSPLSVSNIVIAKFAALFSVMSLIFIMFLTMPLSLYLASDLDNGLFFSATLGVWLTLAVICAVSLYASSLTPRPSLSVLIAYLILFFLTTAATGTLGLDANSITVEFLTFVSLGTHLNFLLLGLVDAKNIIYFFAMTLIFLTLVKSVLQRHRYHAS